jgi:serine-type D-Ala-D-Ala carboxypeptidase (penicillin-binding protein 5/6)
MRRGHFSPSIVTALLATAFTSQPVVAQADYNSSAPIAYMVDLSSGSVLYNRKSKKLIPPASMAKMLTAYVVFDMIAKKQLLLEQKFSLDQKSFAKWNNIGSTMFLKAGDPVSVSNLLHGLLTLSGNDAAISLAEGIDGSEQKFVVRMNKAAKKLGMLDSKFGTANGWPDSGKTLTTAQDLSILARRTLNDFPALYMAYYGKSEFRWGNVTQPNRNPILATVPGSDGMKTGHTDEAGYCFTGTAKQNGRRILIVVAGLQSQDARAAESTAFMKWGFSEWRVKPLFKKSQIIGEAKVQLGGAMSVPLMTPNIVNVTIPIDKEMTYQTAVQYYGPIRAPILKGQHVADLLVTTNDGRIATMPLLAERSVDKAGFFGLAWNGFKQLLGMA